MSSELIEREPRRVRPPYDQPDERLERLSHGDTETWRQAVRADRLEALLEPLDGLPVTDYERAALEWLAGWETSTVAVVAALLRRAREAAPLGESGGAR